ncbi:synaptonemal complex protein 3 isoform X1 [Syngnathus typhle]|uniref:synaptonemal complex protein 3 isoform X1 n=1 Tax=Syngnathus typhle TaxID=161592 RepID=UPI002A6B7D25|nr:synaptonemal complex protein 3 isoform X1 [Syngnathus typhle]
MSTGKRMKKKKLSEEAMSKVFDFSPVAKKKALHCGSEDDVGEASEEKTPSQDKAPSRKRVAEDFKAEEDTGVPVGVEVHSMLERFGADINKVMLTKRKRLENLTKTYMNGGQQKMEQLWNNYHKQRFDNMRPPSRPCPPTTSGCFCRACVCVRRQKMTQDYSQQLSSVSDQWQLEMQQIKDQEEKFNNLIRQQQKVIQQSKILQTQKIEAMQELFKNFVKNMEEMEKNQEEVLHRAQQELRKEMATMQKKILMDTQQQEMASVRKSLQTMLF